VERERATSTDERLGDLARSVERGFERTDEDLRALSVRLYARIDAWIAGSIRFSERWFNSAAPSSSRP